MNYRRLDEINDEIEFLMIQSAKQNGKFDEEVKKKQKTRDQMLKYVNLAHWWKHEEARLDRRLEQGA